MDILSQEFIISAFQAEKDGIDYPIDFEEIWEAFGYTHKNAAKRFLLNRSGIFEPQSQLTLAYIDTKTDKIMLSVDGLKFALARANTSKGAEYLLYLIAVEKLYRQQLERALNTPINPQLDPTRFDYCFDAAIQVSGHRNKYNTMQRLLAYLNEGCDYRWEGATLWLCNPIYYSFIVASRTVKGIDVEKIGQTVIIDWVYYCRVNKALRTPKNALFPKRCFSGIDGQQTLAIEV